MQIPWWIKGSFLWAITIVVLASLALGLGIHALNLQDINEILVAANTGFEDENGRLESEITESKKELKLVKSDLATTSVNLASAEYAGQFIAEKGDELHEMFLYYDEQATAVLDWVDNNCLLYADTDALAEATHEWQEFTENMAYMYEEWYESLDDY